ncbi:hypothetical protein ACWCQS_40545 [Streptomyces sp. NPDC002076]
MLNRQLSAAPDSSSSASAWCCTRRAEVNHPVCAAENKPAGIEELVDLLGQALVWVVELGWGLHVLDGRVRLRWVKLKE